MQTRFKLVLMAALAAIVAVAVGCGGSDDDGGGGGGDESSSGPITIAATYGLTGDMSFFDVPHLAGVEMAVEDVNADGGVDGRQLRVISDDNASNPKNFVPSAKEMVDKDPALLMVSNSDTTGSAAAKVANDAGILSMGTSGPTVFGSPVGDLVFNTWYGDPTEAAVLAEFAQEKDWDSVVLLEDQALGYTKDMCELFSRSYAMWYDDDAIIDRVTFNSANDQTFPSQVTAVRAAAPEAKAIVVCGLPTGAPTLMKEIRAAGIDLPFLGTGGALDGDYWAEAVPNLGEFYADAVPSSVFDNNPDKKQRQLAERYGEELTSGHIYVGYSAVQMLVEAIKMADGSTDGEDLAAALEQFKDFPTMAGPTTYTEECHVPTGRTVAVTEIVDGKGRFIKNLTPNPEYIAKPDNAPC